MAISLNGVRVIRGEGIAVVGSAAIALVGSGQAAPISSEQLRAVTDLVEADDPLDMLAGCVTGDTPVAVWTITDVGPAIAVRGSLAPIGAGHWIDDRHGDRIWRPDAGAFHGVGVHDESRATPAAVGVWSAAGIAVGERPWWDPDSAWDLPLPDDSDEQSQEGLPVVEGVLCPNGHVVNPVGRFCHVDGLSLENVSRVIVTGPRHPFAGLITGGHQHVLLRSAVLGRAPESDRRVVAGEALAVPVDDGSGAISRVHTLVEVDGWTVRVHDLDSSLGTFVLLEGADEWVRIPARARYEVPTRARLRLGDVEIQLTRSDVR